MEFPTNLFRQLETPFYYYDLDLLDKTLLSLSEAAQDNRFKIHYAVKANANPAILKKIADTGLGADVVSLGEIKRAIQAGFKPQDIMFAGVGKTDHEITEALRTGIGCFNVESEPELDIIAHIAQSLGTKAPVALRINPGIDAHTHHYITTGLAENKFGIDIRDAHRLAHKCATSEHLDLKGFHFHIGSQITDLTPYKILCQRINEFTQSLNDIQFQIINVGGGLGIDYDNPTGNPIPDFRTYFDIFARELKTKPGQQIHFELGRAIVAQCGTLISKVLYVKKGYERNFAIIDAGFTELIRPALYQAQHKIINLTSQHSDTEKYDIVGPICESTDTFDTDLTLPVTQRGDIIAILSAGAYGEAMASTYNCRPLVPAILSK